MRASPDVKDAFDILLLSLWKAQIILRKTKNKNMHNDSINSLAITLQLFPGSLWKMSSLRGALNPRKGFLRN